MYYGVLVAHKDYHGESELTYESSEALAVGQVVSIRMRNKSYQALVVSSTDKKPSFKTSSITSVWPFILPASSLQLLEWLQRYYPAPLGAIGELFVPNLQILRAKLQIEKAADHMPIELPPLTAEQSNALEQLTTPPLQNSLLHGDTGTGKTRLYIERVKISLAAEQSALILTPEIGLAEPLQQRFSEVFGSDRVIVWNSAQNNASKARAWARLMSKEPTIIIGTRSALFAPVSKLGVIIIDECHDSAYKQESQPYYQATRVAARLSSLHGCQLILGSATPLIQDYYAFEQKKLPILRLTSPAIQSDQKVTHQLIDLGDSSLFEGSASLSKQLLGEIKAALQRNEQSLLFLNRRGSARVIKCSNCGWHAACNRCDSGLIYHADKHQTLCHSCGLYADIPDECPECQHHELLYLVAGTKAIEAELKHRFPEAVIKRFDKDSAAGEHISRQYEEVVSGKVDILVGTQGLVKGFDLPKLSVVGIIHADSSLQIADYTAAERTYQLISQVAGRLGRGHRAGTIVLQSYQPDSQLINWALNKKFDEFYKQELDHRLTFRFPPASYLLKIKAKRASVASVKQLLEELIPTLTQPGVEILGPFPSYPEKQTNKYCWQLVLRSKNRTQLSQLASRLSSKFITDLDPNSLL